MEILVANGFTWIKGYKTCFLGLNPIFSLHLTERKDMEQLRLLLEELVPNYALKSTGGISPYAAYSAVGFHPEINAQELEKTIPIKCSDYEFERLVDYLTFNFPQIEFGR